MNKLYSKIAALSVGLAMAIGVGVAVGGREAKVAKAADVAISNVFNADTMQTSVSSYTATWVNSSGMDLTLSNFNNYNKGWNLVKAGRKNNTSVATIVTGSVPQSIKSVKVTVDSVTASKVNSAKLYVSSTDDFATSTEFTTTVAAGVMTYTITSPSANKYYKLEYDLASHSSNGFLVISKVEYVYESAATLQSIELVKGENAKVAYVDGDSVSFDDIKAIGHYSDSTSSDLSSSCTITADRAKVATGETKITYSATYNPGGFSIADLDVEITVEALAISSVEKNGNYRTSFVEKQKFSYGTGKLKVTWNNGTSQTINPTAEGVTTKIGTTDITGQTHYMTLSDSGEDLVLSYAGFNVTVGTVSVAPYVEPENGYWSPITDLSDLEVGLEVIIVASGHEYAMDKYTSGNNVGGIEISKDGEGKISSSIPGVQVYTLAAGNVAGSYAFYDGSQYLAATGGTSSNYLKAESEISNNSSFMISIVSGDMKIVGQGSTASGARMTMRFNDGDTVLAFSCYSSSSTTGSLACLYKFTKESKSADQIAVENFCKTSLHLDDSDPSYIDPNDNTSGTACKGETGYYSLAKEAYNGLTEAQVEIFATSADVLIAQGRARLAAWAEANGETFDAVSGTFSAYVPGFALASGENNNTMIIVISIAAVSALAFTMLLVFKKKKQK